MTSDLNKEMAMQESVDLKSMSFDQIQQHVSRLQSTLHKVSVERDVAVNEKNTLTIREKALQAVNTLAGDIVRLTASTPMSITRRQWVANQIQTAMITLRDSIVNITVKLKDGVIEACKEMYKAAMTVMNFINDHFDSIVAGALIVSTIAVLGALCLLSTHVIELGGVVTLAVAGVEANPFSYLF